MHLADAQIKSSWRVVRTRLYFTSESHLHALLTALRAPAQGDVADDHAAADAAAADAASLVDGEAAKWLSQIPELSYLSHMVFRLWEDKSMDPADPRRHMVELSFSPGTPLEYNTEESPGRADDGGDDSDDEFDVAGPRLLVGKHRSLVGGGPPQGRRLGQLYGFGTRSEAAPPVFFQPHWSAYSNPAVDSCRCPLNRSNALPT